MKDLLMRPQARLLVTLSILAAVVPRLPPHSGMLRAQTAPAAMAKAETEEGAGPLARETGTNAERDRLRNEAARSALAMSLWLHRWIIMATLALFFVFHAALLWYYPRRLANRCFCVTLFLALVTMAVLHLQEATDGCLISPALYWVFLALVSACMLSGLALAHALWGDHIPPGKLLGWGVLAVVLYGIGFAQTDRRVVFAILPLCTIECVRVFVSRAKGKLGGTWIFVVGIICFSAAQTVSVLHHLFSFFSRDNGLLAYFWVYGFLALLACVSVHIGREFAGAMGQLEALIATLETRVQQITRQLEKKLLAQARLETLRYQLNPHFLFNALSSVDALSRENPGKIPEVVRRLCQCLRYSLRQHEGGLATVQQELNEAASYLYVEKVRFEDQLEVEVDVSQAAQNQLVPEMLLQPLVENAVKHGMRSSDLPLRIALSAHCVGGFLRLEVRNTGRWSSQAGTNVDGGGGIGLENLVSRLDLLYGDSYRFAAGENSGWVSIVVEIPLKETLQHGDGQGDPG